MYSPVNAAVTPSIAIVRGVRADQYGAPTPCTEFDVRALLGHLQQYGPALEAAAHKETAPAEPGVDLPAQLDRIAVAWGAPQAWEGQTSIRVGPARGPAGGKMGAAPIPAAMFGGMVLTEVVVHGWDLARATGQEPKWDDDVLGFVHDELVKTAELGRQMGLYGAEVPIPPGAPLLERVVGLTGRDPNWQPKVVE